LAVSALYRMFFYILGLQPLKTADNSSKVCDVRRKIAQKDGSTENVHTAGKMGRFGKAERW